MKKLINTCKEKSITNYCINTLSSVQRICVAKSAMSSRWASVSQERRACGGGDFLWKSISAVLQHEPVVSMWTWRDAVQLLRSVSRARVKPTFWRLSDISSVICSSSHRAGGENLRIPRNITGDPRSPACCVGSSWPRVWSPLGHTGRFSDIGVHQNVWPLWFIKCW